MIEPKRDNSISSLDLNFRKKLDPWRSEVVKKYPTARLFETRRSSERQKWLYGVGRTHNLQKKPITWTLTSRHMLGIAVDVVFIQKDGNIGRNGPYGDLIVMAKKHGIRNLKPRETCHFEG